jgi:hypothetical protein
MSVLVLNTLLGHGADCTPVITAHFVNGGRHTCPPFTSPSFTSHGHVWCADKILSTSSHYFKFTIENYNTLVGSNPCSIGDATISRSLVNNCCILIYYF